MLRKSLPASAAAAAAVPIAVSLSHLCCDLLCLSPLCCFPGYNLSEESRATTRHGLECASFGCETAVYVYLGANFTWSFGNISQNLFWNPTFLGVAMVLCFVSRAAGVFLLSVPFNLLSSPSHRIPFKMQVVIWWSGLRGSVSFALALNVPGRTNALIVTTTLAIVLFTTIVCGGMTERVVRACDMKNPPAGAARIGSAGGGGGDAGPKEGLDETLLGADMVSHLSGDGERMYQADHSRSLVALWKRFDQHFMKRWFGGKSHDRVYKSTAQAEAELGLGSPSAASAGTPRSSKARLSVTADGMPALALSPTASSSQSPPGPSSLSKRSGSASPRGSQSPKHGGANSPLVSRGNRLPKYGTQHGGGARSHSPPSASSTGSASSNSRNVRKGRD